MLNMRNSFFLGGGGEGVHRVYGNVKVANNVLIVSNMEMRKQCCNLTSL